MIATLVAPHKSNGHEWRTMHDNNLGLKADIEKTGMAGCLQIEVLTVA